MHFQRISILLNNIFSLALFRWKKETCFMNEFWLYFSFVIFSIYVKRVFVQPYHYAPEIHNKNTTNLPNNLIYENYPFWKKFFGLLFQSN